MISSSTNGAAGQAVRMASVGIKGEKWEKVRHFNFQFLRKFHPAPILSFLPFLAAEHPGETPIPVRVQMENSSNISRSSAQHHLRPAFPQAARITSSCVM